MPSSSRILALAGSARCDSFNKKLIRLAAKGATDAGAECILIDLREYPLPIYDGDLEANEGLPENAVRLKEHFSAADGLLISTPEYNSSLPALLKNTLDWVSRSPQATPDLAPIAGKIVGLMAASPGPLGGMRALAHLRSILSNVGCVVLPAQVTVRQAHEAFTEQGQLTNSGAQQRVEALGAEVAAWTARNPHT